MNVDVAIVGAGPAGLCFAKALAGTGLSIALIERQSIDELREPAFDGREIALTQRSICTLRELGVWTRIHEADQSPLRSARVLNGSSSHGLHVTPQGTGHDELGVLVPNDRIRRAALECIEHEPNIRLISNTTVNSFACDGTMHRLQLSDGDTVSARLLVAADSRFSQLRRDAGIGADMHDFGKTMLVCRMSLEKPHAHEALEWFGHGQTLAILPLRGAEASVVLTLPGHEVNALTAMDDASFHMEMQRRTHHRFGQMQLTSTRHAYPLVGVYARRFVAPGFALIGDAAVGMHPVTAHGFNLGLQGVEALSGEIRRALASGQNIASPPTLLRYERTHRLATRPLYLATLAIVKLYTDDRTPARFARHALLRASQAATPFRHGLARMLAASGARRSLA